MTKAEHQAQKTSVKEMLLCNEENEEKYII